MGSYLTKPIKEKISIDESSEDIDYGASSMQGWRSSQEDAHNALLDFGENTYFFAVYDGHGGEEVAQYTAENFPQHFRKNLNASTDYRLRNIAKILIKTFMEFDSKLLEPDILKIIQNMANESSDGDREHYEEELAALRKEAKMPIAELVEKMTDGRVKSVGSIFREVLGASSSGRPNLDDEKDETCNLEEKLETCNSEEKLETCNSEEKLETCNTEEKTAACNTKEVVEACNTKEVVEACNTIEKVEICNNKVKAEIPTIKTLVEEKGSKDEASGQGVEKVHNGESHSNETNDGQNDDSSDTKDSVINCDFKKGKGKGHSKGKNVLSAQEVEDLKKSQRPKLRTSLERQHTGTHYINQFYDLWSDEKSDSEDDEDVQLESEEAEECSDEESSNNEDEEEEEEGCDHQVYLDKEEVCYDSGCTACVAYIEEDMLYVANVGDSRCVFYRDGYALDLSEDHKPEDLIERTRISLAGGKITEDGRVNGGLNLSRALGDHRYKQNKSMDPEEQMISAEPDIKIIDITEKDKFMVIACDGIWNSMTSQEVCDMIDENLESQEKLSSICEKIFDACLAPDTSGDGTGCDNMTCIIVKFKKFKSNKKRIAEISSEELKENIDNYTKKSKIEL